MSEDNRDERDLVTRSEFREALGKLPTRWEVRFLIVAGLLASQFVPVAETAKAALPWM